MTNRTMLVTGATDGIGRATVDALAAQGAHVLVHGRDPARVARVVASLAARRPGHATGVVADLASLAAVRALADEVRARTARLDVLIHNAGAFMNRFVPTVDGFETTFAVNHLAPFLLTLEMLPLLRASAPARIVVVASVAHTQGRLELDGKRDPDRFDGYRAYASSKLCNVLFTRALARRLGGSGVTVNAVHPGVVTTKLLREGFGTTGISVEEGAAGSVRLATAPELAGVSGRYFSRLNEAQPAPAAQDDRLAERLWEASERLVAPFRSRAAD